MKASKDVGEVDGSAQVEEVPGATERPSKRLQLLNKTPSPKETVFFGNLFYDVTAEDLRLQMEKYGVVEQVSIVFDNRGISRGFAYIQYDTIDSAKRAIEAMNGRVFEGRHAVVQFAQNNVNTLKRLKPVSKTIFIGNLPFEMTDRDLNELFKDIVNVIDIRVSVDRRTGQIRGFAHVEFTNVESARVAFETLSRKAPYGRKLRLDYSYTNRRADHVAEDES
ncbi:nucleic acid-binding protein [Aspergillus tanneri]|nr:uncharacterized protein ATNIH1004_004375 [Aspergillus tanneri]KAA8648490.1 hypothetical protein ATNIH1004_004375 [Aspergillus tanneri]